MKHLNTSVVSQVSIFYFVFVLQTAKIYLYSRKSQLQYTSLTVALFNLVHTACLQLYNLLHTFPHFFPSSPSAFGSHYYLLYQTFIFNILHIYEIMQQFSQLVSDLFHLLSSGIIYTAANGGISFLLKIIPSCTQGFFFLVQGIELMTLQVLVDAVPPSYVPSLHHVLCPVSLSICWQIFRLFLYVDYCE